MQSLLCKSSFKDFQQNSFHFLVFRFIVDYFHIKFDPVNPCFLFVFKSTLAEFFIAGGGGGGGGDGGGGGGGGGGGVGSK